MNPELLAEIEWAIADYEKGMNDAEVAKTRTPQLHIAYGGLRTALEYWGYHEAALKSRASARVETPAAPKPDAP